MLNYILYVDCSILQISLMKLNAYYHRTLGYEYGVSTGWKNLNDLYNVREHARKLLEKHIKKPFFDKRTKTEYVSQMLTQIKRFAQHHCCRVWFVAHPRQLHQWTGGPPNLYDISGSAHFGNKCDNGIVIHRNRDPEAGEMDQVQHGRCFYETALNYSGGLPSNLLQLNQLIMQCPNQTRWWTSSPNDSLPDDAL
ncbi:hypothetical protein FF1_036266 [Malus domestica]